MKRARGTTEDEERDTPTDMGQVGLSREIEEGREKHVPAGGERQ